ncbi:MAG: hypothetical protein Q8R02_04860 [Hyphomonadaceae bacterium]|nr:hypothetical protein [Hyphomonadaceae bacterium]
MAKTPIEEVLAAHERLVGAYNELAAESAAMVAILTAVVATHRMDPQNGKERLAALRDLSSKALPVTNHGDPMDAAARTVLRDFFDNIEEGARVTSSKSGIN